MTELTGMALVRELERQGKEILAQHPKDCRHQQSALTAEKLFGFIYAYELMLPDLNAAKRKLDAAHKQENVTLFEEALSEFTKTAHSLWPAKTALKSRKRWYKIHADLLQDAKKKIHYMETTITGGKQWVKEMSMSPKQRAAAKKASVRMQMRWGI